MQRWFTQRRWLLGRAVELLHFEPIYRDVFGHVFGDTLVYSDLQSPAGWAAAASSPSKASCSNAAAP